MANPTQLRSYAAGYFQFHLDGVPDSAYIKSVDGGNAKAELVTDQVGVDFTAFKSAATVGFQPISLELGMAASQGIIDWISDSWKRSYSRRNGSILHADFNGNTRLEQWFYDAIICETVFPKLDAKDNSPAYLTVKLQPERVELKHKVSGGLSGNVGSKQKLWTPSSFGVSINGINCDGVSAVDSFTVKQKHKELYCGPHRFPQIEPTGLEFPNINLTMSAAYAGDFFKWYEDVVVKGKKDTKGERQGAIVFYDPQGSIPLLTVELKNVGIFNLQVEKSDSHSDSIKKVKVELYVEGMSITDGFGLE